MKSYLNSWEGRRCPIDLDNPLVIIKSEGLCSPNYSRGSLVYPIGDGKGGKPGEHHSEGYITVSTLNTDTANFLGFQVGKSIIPLKELIEISASELSISRKQGRKSHYFMDGQKIDEMEAIELMLDYYTFMKLPENVRNAQELSKLVSYEPTLYERGIIFDSLEELAYALKVYERGSIRGSKATEDRFFSDSWKSDTSMSEVDDRFPTDSHKLVSGVDDPSLFRQTPKASFVEMALELINQKRGSLADEMIVGIYKSDGKYRRDFDYDAFGTSFFKTNLEVEKIDGKYVLGIWAAYVGDKPEKELAQSLGKERGFVRVGSKHIITPIDSNWVGIDLDEVFKGGPLTKTELAVLSRLASGEMKFEYNHPFVIQLYDNRVLFDVDIGQEENCSLDILRVRGNQLFLETKGNGKAYFSATLRASDKEKIVTPEEKIKIIQVRDKLSELINGNLS